MYKIPKKRNWREWGTEKMPRMEDKTNNEGNVLYNTILYFIR